MNNVMEHAKPAGILLQRVPHALLPLNSITRLAFQAAFPAFMKAQTFAYSAMKAAKLVHHSLRVKLVQRDISC